MEGCGYCDNCIRVRVMKSIGRLPERKLECSYKHVLDVYTWQPENNPGTSIDVVSKEPSVASLGSCGSNCRWSTASSIMPSSEEPSWGSGGFFDPAVRISSKRVKFVKRRKVKPSGSWVGWSLISEWYYGEKFGSSMGWFSEVFGAVGRCCWSFDGVSYMGLVRLLENFVFERIYSILRNWNICVLLHENFLIFIYTVYIENVLIYSTIYCSDKHFFMIDYFF